MLPDGSISARKAALLVYALPLAARAAVMDRLPLSQQTQMRQLLEELEQLGIPAHQDWLSHARDDEQVLTPQKAHRQVLESASSMSMVQVLQGQASDVVAAVLNAEPWPWRDVVAECLCAQRTDLREALAHSIRPSAATLDILLARCAQCVQEHGPAPEAHEIRLGAKPQSSWIDRFLGKRSPERNARG